MKLTTTICIYALVACALIFAGLTAVLESAASRGVMQQAHRVTALLQKEMTGCIEGEISNVEANVGRTALASEELRKFRNEHNLATVLRLMIEGDSTIVGGAFSYLPGKSPDKSQSWMIYALRTDSTIVTRQLADSGYAYTDMEWFSEPVRTGKPGWSRPYFDTGAGNCLMITYSIPIKDDSSHVAGIVTADVDLSTLIASIQRLKPYDTSISLLIADDGNPIGNSEQAIPANDREEILREISQQTSGGDLRDRILPGGSGDYLVNYSRIERLGLILCTVTPYNSVVAIFRGMKIPFLIVICAGLLILMAGIFAVVRYVSRPLSRFSKAAAEIGKGNFDTELPETGNLTEMRELHDAMEKMQTSIAGYITDIETTTRRNERIRSELDIAAKIQKSMLPPPWKPRDGIHISTLLESAREVSGDMYDHVTERDSIYVMIADVSGKGVPASLVMTAVMSLFRAEAKRGAPPSEIMKSINSVISKGNSSCMFVTAIILRLKNSTLSISNAGHTPPFIRKDGIWQQIVLNPALPLGIMEETPYADTDITFPADSPLLLYTDGLTEAEDNSGNLFGEKRLSDLLSTLPTAGTQEIVSAIRDCVARFSPDRISDDITIVCMDKGSLRKRLSLPYSTGELGQLTQFTAELGIPDADRNKTDLILEEAVTNIINHSRPAGENDLIEISAENNGARLTLTISDSGDPFDPLSDPPEVDTTLPLELRQEGGLGIFLIRNLSDSVSHRYENRHNILEIKINLTI